MTKVGRWRIRNMYYIYLLRCEDNSLYTGITTDLARRLNQHQRGKGAKYTASHGAKGIECAFRAANRSLALRLEYRIKCLDKLQKESLLQGILPPSIDWSDYTRVQPINEERMDSMTLLCYDKCTTCRKAKAYLESKGVQVTQRDIKGENPTIEELRQWHQKSGLPLKRFFNTSGLQYKALGLSKTLPTMGEEERFALLASDGMLVNRPILVEDDFVLVGFTEPEWAEKLGA